MVSLWNNHVKKREMSTSVIHPYIFRQEGVQGARPVITGTRTMVRSIIIYHKIGDTAEEIKQKLPHLALAQVYDALSYYDFREEIDHDIEADTEENVKREFGL